MRRLFALLLFAFAASVSAQPVCIPGFYGTMLDVTAPRRSEAGWRIVWLCQGADGKPRIDYLVCEHGPCVETKLRDAIYNATRASDPVAAIKAAWTANATASCATATGAFKTVCDEAAADGATLLKAYLARSAVVAAEVWKVAPNASYTTRPTYAWSNGVRGTAAATERVAVGADCNPAIGVDNYRGVLGRADRVALCRKQ